MPLARTGYEQRADPRVVRLGEPGEDQGHGALLHRHDHQHPPPLEAVGGHSSERRQQEGRAELGESHQPHVGR